MTAIMQRSAEASRVDSEARRHVDQVEQAGCKPLRMEDARRIYTSAVGSICHRRMLEELAPINRELCRLQAMSLGPIVIPPAIEEWREGIHTKWAGVVAELCAA